MSKPTLILTGLVPFDTTLHDSIPSVYLEAQTGMLTELGIASDGLQAPGLNQPALRSGLSSLRPPFPPLSRQAQEGFASVATTWVLADMAQRFPELVFVIAYNTPWHAFHILLSHHPERFIPDPGAAIRLWIAYYKQVLGLRRTLGARIMIVRASAATSEAQALRACLQQRFAALPPAGQPTYLHQADNPGLTAIFSRMLEMTTPECWDIYEALESCAELFGHEPEYRNTAASADESSMDTFLQHWGQAYHVPQLTHAMDALQREQRKETHRHEELQHAFMQQGVEMDRLQTENGRLSAQVSQLAAASADAEQILQQLHAVQEELERLYLDKESTQQLLAHAQASFGRANSVLLQFMQRQQAAVD